MHFDLSHAVVTGVLVYLTLVILKRSGISKNNKDGQQKWDCKVFVAVFVIIFLFNLIRPCGKT